MYDAFDVDVDGIPVFPFHGLPSHAGLITTLVGPYDLDDTGKAPHAAALSQQGVVSLARNLHRYHLA